MNLILLANGFPYGNWEPYLETEVQYYKGFSAVHICAMQLRKEHKDTIRPLPSDRSHVCPVPFASVPVYMLHFFSVLTDRNFYKELKRLAQQKSLTPVRLAWAFFYISRSHYEARKIWRYLTQTAGIDTDEEVVFYSYRFDYQPYVALLLKKHFSHAHVIARGHRSDLYEEIRPSKYIAMRPYLLEHLDEVILIADYGRRYLANKYPQYQDKLSVYRLGTKDHGIGPAPQDRSSIRLVSCSGLTPVKRVHLIVQALALITDREVYWTHYGEGPLMAEIQQRCTELPGNIHWDLRGYVDNPAMLEEYGLIPYHLFLNVSQSEGVPVSIMEALSFGIPCIATDVGGTAEIVTSGQNGTLLPEDLSPQALADCIRDFASMPEEGYAAYRARARASWEERYDADKNYTAFAEHLSELGGSHP